MASLAIATANRAFELANKYQFNSLAAESKLIISENGDEFDWETWESFILSNCGAEMICRLYLLKIKLTPDDSRVATYRKRALNAALSSENVELLDIARKYSQ
eukprot:TRINITY_DN145746_c0_g1_i2.p1 TRINITY_DN145746_c0_g1~~TRINITY_DN145746_c0_g1_i2.p1  ORF type:complete len:103 (+),score=29.36 TRINITY_DN145746_c0_g1_i2:352-660(+)